MGIVITVVVTSSAVVNIYTQRHIQSSIVQMTRYRTNVRVFRDGEWRELSSPDVAPGDLVKVSENWAVPCDMAIVKGRTVCDESMLTGESMPVQKFPIPEYSNEVYDPEKGSKKHTLFAGPADPVHSVPGSDALYVQRAPEGADLDPVCLCDDRIECLTASREQGIFSPNVQRITLCGKVRIFCFDKTGTLTKQGLDFLGVQPVKDTRFAPIVNDVKDAPSAEELLYALATCHSVGSLEDRLVGNEVEVRMFTATGWELVEKEGEQPYVKSKVDPGLELEFVKRYDFDHHRMSMSVVVRNRKSGKYYVFCKGSYERMQQLSTSASVPDDYKSVADRLAKDGCYVLGLSYRELPSDWTHEQVVAFAGNRDAVDENLSLLGLILFRNELKDDTADAIAKLKGGDIRTVMITGDNAMCGCYIARKSGMVASSSRVILGEMVSTTEVKKLVWRDVDSEEEYDLPAVKHLVEQGGDVELAVTGVAFDYLVAMGEIKGLLLNIRIFSRMTPDGKVECVKLHMETGAVTGMCGDGGNDCGALRFAHAGVALSDAEASVVSPFTSREKTIQSVVDLCREGRCSVATSFASVKFLIMDGLIGSVLWGFQSYYTVIIAEWCWILAEGVTMLGFSYLMTRAKPLKELGDVRPTSSLIGPTTLASIFGQQVINVIYLCCAIHLLTSEVWYCPFLPKNINMAQWWLMGDNHLSTLFFFTIIFQQHTAAWVFSFGSRYRQPIWRNYMLMAFFAVVVTLDLYLLLGEPSVIMEQFRISSSTNVIGLPDIPMPMSFRLNCKSEQAVQRDDTKWRVEDMKALAVLVKMLSPTYQSMVRECKTAHEAWEMLKNFFSKKNLHNRVQLRKQLHEFSMESGADLMEHMLNFDELCLKLSAAGDNVSEDEKMAILLGSLPSEYDAMVRIIETQSETTLLDTKEMLRREFETLQKREQKETAFKATAQRGGRGGYHGRGRGRSRGGNRWNGGRRGNFPGKYFVVISRTLRGHFFPYRNLPSRTFLEPSFGPGAILATQPLDHLRAKATSFRS
ncbi:unnamed protein product [Phytophthora lilii]|uniref:Unnamed protein product n=1 Tax=Phytophthora lilii TaxID=2077276 RepID=A0A9W6TLE5_9STRA|nr:unnamed protein product [Phytophthora lilii]